MKVLKIVISYFFELMSVVRLNNDPQISFWNLVNVNLHGKRDLAEEIKDLAMGRLVYTIPLGPKCNHNCPYKRTEEGISPQKRKRLCENRSRDWNNVVTSQETQALLKAGRDKKQILSRRLQKEPALLTP